ncbi:glycosyl hydrolase family 28-related protein [Leifsonia sp. NPDC080035]|uniref:Glycosyl hydrolase family 28-related protein n=1 Tax=Leifsonia sp. NPDC080035 TaxID=3143936 RepID=A0AAU7GH92_9MICO
MDAAGTIIDVTEFGADPNGSADSTPAIAAALAAASTAAGPVTVDFPPGRYELWPESASRRELDVTNTVGDDERFRVKTIAVLIENADRLTLRGDGALLRTHGRQTAIAVLDSTDVTIAGIAIDYAVPTVVDATVVETGVEDGHGYCVVCIPETNPFRVEGRSVVWTGGASPETGQPYWEGRDGMAYTQMHDPVAQRTWRVDGSPLFEGVERLRRDGRRLRIEYATAEEPDTRGLVFQMRDTVRDHPGVLFSECTGVVLRDVQAHYLHGLGVVAQLCRDVTIDRVTFRAPRKQGRSSAAFADFLQLASLEGDVVIRGCVFDGPHDDPINVHGSYLAVTAVGDDTLALSYPHPETSGLPVLRVGDDIEVVDARTLRRVAGPLAVLTVDGPSGRDRDHDPRTATITLAAPLPPGLTGREGLVVENVTRTPAVSIAGNRFVNVPTRGILVTTRRPVRIESNVFDGITMAGVFIAGDAVDWYESGPVHDVRIRGNRFLRVDAPAVLVAPSTAGAGGTGARVHGRIVVEENLFETAAGPVVDAHDVAELVVRANAIDVAEGDAVRSSAVDRSTVEGNGPHQSWTVPSASRL